MSNRGHFLDNDQLIEVFTLTKTATAVHVTEDAIIQTANDAMLAIWGKDRSVIGKSLEDALPELKGQPFIDMFKRVWNEGLTISGTDTAADLVIGGILQRFYFDFEYRAVTDATGATICILHSAMDVTDRVVGKLAMERLEEQRSALLREQALNEELGAANEEMLATNEALQKAQDRLSELNESLEVLVLERTRALSLSEARFRNFFEQAPLAFAVLKGPDLIIELANQNMLQLWGRNADVIGQKHHSVRASPEAAPFLKVLDDVYRSGKPFAGDELRAFTARGNKYEWGYFNFVYQPLLDAANEVTGILIIVSDVTEMVLTREGASRTNDQLKLALESARMGTWHIVPETMFLSYSPTLADLFGYKADTPMTYLQAIGQVTPAFREDITRHIDIAIAGGGDYDMTYSQRRFDNNELIWLRSLGKVSKTANGQYTSFSGIVMDITKMVEAEREVQQLNRDLAAGNGELQAINNELQTINEELVAAQEALFATNASLTASEENFRLATDSANVGVWNAQKNKDTIDLSDRCRRFYGFDAEAIITLKDIEAIILPEYRSRTTRILENAIVHNLDCDTQYPIAHVVTGETRWLRSVGKSYVESGEGLTRFFAVTIDVTEEKKDEERKNDFIAMVSHELKTPLTTLNGYVQLMLAMGDTADHAFTNGAMEKSLLQIRKMTTMINGFLNVSRLASGKIVISKKPFSIGRLVEEMIEESRFINPYFEIRLTPGEDIMVEADRDKIGSVVSNLLSNAIKYVAGEKRIDVAFYQKDSSVVLRFKDYGIGISKEDQLKLFDRYFRVNSDKTISGFGIGLYLSAEIVHRHNGSIWVESEPGTGSTFYVSIPLREIPVA